MGIEDQFATVVFELAPDAMAVTDEYGRMVHVNGRFETVFGFDRDDLVGRSVEVLLPDRLKAVHRSHRRDYERRPRPRPMGGGRELWARHRDGTEFLVEVSLSPVSTADGQCTIMAVRAASETPSTDPRGEADGPVRESFFHDLDAGVIRPIFSASLGLHGLLDGATPGQAEVLRHAIAELDDALRSLRHLALEHTLLARAPDGGMAPPDHHQAREGASAGANSVRADRRVRDRRRRRGGLVRRRVDGVRPGQRCAGARPALPGAAAVELLRDRRGAGAVAGPRRPRAS